MLKFVFQRKLKSLSMATQGKVYYINNSYSKLQRVHVLHITCLYIIINYIKTKIKINVFVEILIIEICRHKLILKIGSQAT